MKRVMFEYDMFGGFVEIKEPRMLHPEAGELWTDHGEVPDDVWDRYQRAVAEMSDAFKVLHASLTPLNLSPEEADEARLAHEKYRSDEEAELDAFERGQRAAQEQCPHTDEYGSLFQQDDSCAVCGYRHLEP